MRQLTAAPVLTSRGLVRRCLYYGEHHPCRRSIGPAAGVTVMLSGQGGLFGIAMRLSLSMEITVHRQKHKQSESKQSRATASQHQFHSFRFHPHPHPIVKTESSRVDEWNCDMG
jgi:hypothetical protein